MINSLLEFLSVWLLVFFLLGVCLHIWFEEYLWKYKRLGFIKKLSAAFLVAAVIDIVTILGVIVFTVTVEFLGKL